MAQHRGPIPERDLIPAEPERCEPAYAVFDFCAQCGAALWSDEEGAHVWAPRVVLCPACCDAYLRGG